MWLVQFGYQHVSKKLRQNQKAGQKCALGSIHRWTSSLETVGFFNAYNWNVSKSLTFRWSTKKNEQNISHKCVKTIPSTSGNKSIIFPNRYLLVKNRLVIIASLYIIARLHNTCIITQLGDLPGHAAIAKKRKKKPTRQDMLHSERCIKAPHRAYSETDKVRPTTVCWAEPNLLDWLVLTHSPPRNSTL